jgi:hypothetical protein
MDVSELSEVDEILELQRLEAGEVEEGENMKRANKASPGQYERTYAIFGRACEAIGIQNFYPKPASKKKTKGRAKRVSGRREKR